MRQLRAIKEILASQILVRNLVLFVAIALLIPVFASRKVHAYIVAVLHTGFGDNCRRSAFDSFAQCQVVAFCQPTDDNELIGIDAGVGDFCENYTPTVLNYAPNRREGGRSRHQR